MRIIRFIPLVLIWVVVSCAPAEDVSDQSALLERMSASLHAELEGDVVGYGFAMGTGQLVTGAGGLARLEGDGGPVDFTPDTPMILASVSKLVSALATLHLLQEQGLSVDAAIGPYLPSDWSVDPYIEDLTFAQLMSQTSGIKVHGNGPMSYERLKAFYTQPVDPNSSTPCTRFSGPQPELEITPSDLDFCYSNFNAAILMVLLPKLAGLEEDPNLDTRPTTLGSQYESLVQDAVFAPVGVDTAACAPDSDDYALSYIFPGQAPGKDWGAQYGRCATGGWYVSPSGLAQVLASVAIKDGRILQETTTYSSLAAIRENGFGLDRKSPGMIEKGGVLGDDPGVLATTALIFFPETGDPIPAVLFTNSTSKAGRIAHPRPYLERAYEAAKASTE